MLTSEFDFNLPTKLIAQTPNFSKEDTKMLIFNNQIEDSKVSNLIDYLSSGDVIIFNDVKVINAKIQAFIKRSNAQININLDQNNPDNPKIWKALCKPFKKIKENDEIIINERFKGNIIKKNENGFIDIYFDYSEAEFNELLKNYASIPLPPYIKRNNDENEDDNTNYQTFYAKKGKAVAAPTAGLHFTQNLMNKIKDKNIIPLFITLNVGAGTFLPVKTENILEHKMHSEYFEISEEVCNVVNQAKANNKKIIAVGTTSLRALESAAENGILIPKKCNTDIFIYPGYKFKIIDILMTNFHLPKSTLFMLVSAFVGIENAQEIYQHAIKNNYRFYSYGDSSLLFRK